MPRWQVVVALLGLGISKYNRFDFDKDQLL